LTDNLPAIGGLADKLPAREARALKQVANVTLNATWTKSSWSKFLRSSHPAWI
jgi:hypothetical protein